MPAELCLEAHLAEQPFDAEQAFVALEREKEGLRAEALVVGVQKGDHRPGLAETAPGALEHGILPPQLIGRRED
jgi:hypothetical protein